MRRTGRLSTATAAMGRMEQDRGAPRRSPALWRRYAFQAGAPYELVEGRFRQLAVGQGRRPRRARSSGAGVGCAGPRPRASVHRRRAVVALLPGSIRRGRPGAGGPDKAAAFDRKIIVRIALLALHFAEYSGRLALALAARHDVLLVLNSSNARDELTDDLRAQLERSLTLRCVELPRLRNPRLLLTNWATVRMLRDFAPDVLHMQEVHP